MTGSVGVAGWIAQIVFWAVLAIGAFSGELGPKLIVTFVVLWLAGLFGLPYLPYGEAFFSPCVAVLSVVLALIVFKGDVRLR